ncbi:MAG: hypothetical protein AB1725_11530 [Armatimonadota bacterium]
MRKLLIVVMVLALSMAVAQRVLPQGSCPSDFCDDFHNSPYGTDIPFQRWCERYHHIHYDATNEFMIVPRVGRETEEDCRFVGNSSVELPCEGLPSGCTCDGGGSQCSSTNGGPNSPVNVGAFFVVSKKNYGGTSRTAQVSFGIRAHGTPANGLHLNTFAASHANCHTGVQGVVAVVDQALGTYRVGIIVGNDPLTGFSECGTNEGGAFFAPGTVALSLVGPSNPPNYILRTDSSIGPDGDIRGRARLFAVSNPNAALLDTGNMEFDMTPGTGWYNLPNKGQRFGFGGGPLVQPPIPAEANLFAFDNFVGNGC